MDARPPSRTALLIWMIFSQLMALASLYPLLYMAGVLLTRVIGGRLPDRWAFLLLSSPCPAVAIALSAAAWLAYGRRQDGRAARLAALSFGIPAVILFIMWVTLVGR
ncbi:MAG TPA: hypothetical protein VIU39_15445 [Anaerolineales bacterium]